MADTKNLNLYQKIQAVAKEVMNIEKDMTVGSGNYAYKAVSDTVVTLAVKRAEEKFGLVSIPIKQELINSTIEKSLNNKGEESFTFVDTIKMTLRIIDVDKTDDFIDVETFGKGIDRSDKGLGKASTYARKYGLLNAYKIATGEDPDADKSEAINTPSTPNEKLVLIKNYLATNKKTEQNLLQHFGVDSTDDLNNDQIELTYKTYKEKKLI